MFKTILHITIALALTILTQVGGVAWLLALTFRKRLLAFFLLYAAASITAFWMAPLFGREPLPCFQGQSIQMQSKMYCALNRHYVSPELKAVLQGFGDDMNAEFPDTTTLILDANFPFFDGFPLLPHLSHADGRKVDLAYYYRDVSGYRSNTTKSPIGYFAFEDGPTDCPDAFPTLRWDMAWLQNWWPDLTPDPERMTAALQLLSTDRRVGKIFIEQHLRETLGVQSPKIRFQGCRAARHDDHIHIQL